MNTNQKSLDKGKWIKENMDCCLATEEEIKEQRKRCWWNGCKHRAWLDVMGWHWCLKHWWKEYRWGGGEVGLRGLYYHIKFTKIKL